MKVTYFIFRKYLLEINLFLKTDLSLALARILSSKKSPVQRLG